MRRSSSWSPPAPASASAAAAPRPEHAEHTVQHEQAVGAGSLALGARGVAPLEGAQARAERLGPCKQAARRDGEGVPRCCREPIASAVYFLFSPRLCLFLPLFLSPPPVPVPAAAPLPLSSDRC